MPLRTTRVLCSVTKLHEPASEQGEAVGAWSPATSQLIIDIASAAAGERELDQILHETLDRLRTVIPLTGGSIALVQGEDLVIRAAVGPFADEALGQRLRRGTSLSWQVVETLEPCLLPDMRDVRGRQPWAEGARGDAIVARRTDRPARTRDRPRRDRFDAARRILSRRRAAARDDRQGPVRPGRAGRPLRGRAAGQPSCARHSSA